MYGLIFGVKSEARASVQRVGAGTAVGGPRRGNV